MPCPWASHLIDLDLSKEVDLETLWHIKNCGQCREDLAWLRTVHASLIGTLPTDAAMIERILKGIRDDRPPGTEAEE